MAYCERLGRETTLEEQEEGVLTCPECGESMDAETLETMTQAHYPDAHR